MSQNQYRFLDLLIGCQTLIGPQIGSDISSVPARLYILSYRCIQLFGDFKLHLEFSSEYVKGCHGQLLLFLQIEIYRIADPN
jgi:hypothetical protein